MEQTNNNYPRFEKGQVLTSEALNEYFGYLDEQQRLTRAQLLGVGILSGLEFEYDGDDLIIKKGTAVTADGYLIDLPNDKRYTLAYTYNKNSDMLTKQNPLTGKSDDSFDKVLDKVAYVLYEDEDDATRHNQKLNEKKCIPNHNSINDTYFFALTVDFISQDTITQCNELSCDIVQSNFKIEIRPVVINKKGLLGDTKPNYLLKKKAGKLCEIIKTYNWPKIFMDCTGSEVLSGNTFYTFYNCIFDKLANSNSSNLYYNIKCNIQSSNLYPPIRNTIGSKYNSLMRHYKSFEGLKEKKSHCLQHLLNIQTAIEEYGDYYKDFANKYIVLPLNETAFSRIVILGDLCSIDDEYRQYNSSILHNPQFIADQSLVEKALNRIFLLAESFDFNYVSNYKEEKDIPRICTTIKPNSKLGERIKPGYYGERLTDDDWRLDASCKKNTFEAGCSWVVENYYGMKKSDLEDMFRKIKNSCNFPVTIDYIPVGSIDYIVNKYKKEYKRDEFIEVLKALNDRRNASHGVWNFTIQEKTHLEYSLADIFERIDNKKKVDSNTATKYLNMIKQRLLSYKALNDGIYLKPFHELYFDNIDPKSEMNSGGWPELYKKIRDYLYTWIHENGMSLIFCSDSVNGLDQYSKYIQYCLEYLSFYSRLIPIQIGGCTYNGRLSVFYNTTDEKVLLIMGTGLETDK